MKKKSSSPAARSQPLVQLPAINSVLRNMVWIYQQEVSSRFPKAPSVIETLRSHEMPDLFTLPAEADVTVELYGGAVSFWLDGMRRRIYIEKHTFVEYRSYEEARFAFLELWKMIEPLDSVSLVQEAIEEWRAAKLQS